MPTERKIVNFARVVAYQVMVIPADEEIRIIFQLADGHDLTIPMGKDGFLDLQGEIAATLEEFPEIREWAGPRQQ
jgi:hypothetical protein